MSVVCIMIMLPATPPSRNRKRSEQMLEQVTPRFAFIPTLFLTQSTSYISAAKSSASFFDLSRFFLSPNSFTVFVSAMIADFSFHTKLILL